MNGNSNSKKRSLAMLMVAGICVSSLAHAGNINIQEQNAEVINNYSITVQEGGLVINNSAGDDSGAAAKPIATARPYLDFASAQVIPRMDKLIEVRTGPGNAYYRDGIARVGKKDEVNYLALDNNWLLIDYPVDDGGRRAGYVPESELVYYATVGALPKASVNATVVGTAYCYDDLTRTRAPLATLSNGSEVSFLAEMTAYGNHWAHVQLVHWSGEPMRGFILMDSLSFE